MHCGVTSNVICKPLGCSMFELAIEIKTYFDQWEHLTSPDKSHELPKIRFRSLQDTWRMEGETKQLNWLIVGAWNGALLERSACCNATECNGSTRYCFCSIAVPQSAGFTTCDMARRLTIGAEDFCFGPPWTSPDVRFGLPKVMRMAWEPGVWVYMLDKFI